MKVALFATTVDIRNGYGNITTHFCLELLKRGIDFTLFLPETEKARVAEMKLPYDVRCELPRVVFRIFERGGFRYTDIVDVSAYDLVHSLFAFPLCIVAARAARNYGKPFMMGAQGTYGVLPLTRFPERWLLKRCYRLARKIAVPSAFTRDQILRHARAAYAIDVVHNGVDFERFQRPVDPAPLKARYGDGPFLLTVGGLKERKGQDLVIRALPMILQEFPSLTYLLVGKGEMESALRSLAEGLGVGGNVVFCGEQTGDDLLAHFRLADLYVHTPKVVNLNFEGFGIVYVEAGACGVPSIATDAGGIRDAVKDGETGVVVPDGDFEAVARSVVALLRDPARRARMGSAAKEYAQSHDWRYIVDRFVSYYHELV